MDSFRKFSVNVSRILQRFSQQSLQNLFLQVMLFWIPTESSQVLPGFFKDSSKNFFFQWLAIFFSYFFLFLQLYNIFFFSIPQEFFPTVLPRIRSENIPVIPQKFLQVFHHGHHVSDFCMVMFRNFSWNSSTDSPWILQKNSITIFPRNKFQNSSWSFSGSQQVFEGTSSGIFLGIHSGILPEKTVQKLLQECFSRIQCSITFLMSLQRHCQDTILQGFLWKFL